MHTFILIPAPCAAAQEWDHPHLPAVDLVERSGESSLENRAQALLELAEQPVDLNTASPSDIAAVPGFTDRTAALLVSFRRANGPFASVGEIERVPGIDADVLRRAVAYIRVSKTTATAAKPQILLAQKLSRRVEVARGYRQTDGATSYTGSPVASKTRIGLTYLGLRGNLSLEKDAGEPIVWAPSKRRLAFDHVAANLSYSGEAVVEQLTLGDYRLSGETGLLIGTPSVQSPDRPMRHASGGIHARSAPSEGPHLRGAAATVRVLRSVRVTAAFSSRRRDARITDPADESNSVALSSEDGLHRTSSEIDSRGRVRERLLAISFNARVGALSFGGTAYQLTFSHPIAPADRPDEKWAFRGRRQRAYSAHIALVRAGTFCKGELSLVQAQSAAVAYCRWKPDKKLQAWFLARSYGTRAVALLGSTYGRSGGPPENETGILLGFKRRIKPRTSLSFHTDVWWSAWLRFQQHTPTSGAEATITFETAGALAQALIRVTTLTRSDAMAAYGPGTSVVKTSGRRTEHRLAASARISASNAVRLDSRTTLTQTRHAGSQKAVISGAVSLRANASMSPSLNITAQASAFHATGGTRVYLVQPAMASGFGIRSASGRGQQWVVVISCSLTPALLIQTRFAHTTTLDVLSTGSGLDETRGPRSREVGVQLRLRT